MKNRLLTVYCLLSYSHCAEGWEKTTVSKTASLPPRSLQSNFRRGQEISTYTCSIPEILPGTFAPIQPHTNHAIFSIIYISVN